MITKTILSAAVVATTISAGAAENVAVKEINTEFDKATIQLCCGYHNFSEKEMNKRERKSKRMAKKHEKVEKKKAKIQQKADDKIAKL